MASETARAIDPAPWKRLAAGEGTKGARLHDWAYCELADRDAAEYDDERIGLWTRGLLIRRNIVDGDMAFFSTWCPAGGLQRLQDRTAIDPLVGPGNPPHRHPPCPKTDQPRSRHCMFRLPTPPST